MASRSAPVIPVDPSLIVILLRLNCDSILVRPNCDFNASGPSMYIDPSAGSLVLQLLAAGALSAVAMVSRLREAVKSFLKSLVPRRKSWPDKH